MKSAAAAAGAVDQPAVAVAARMAYIFGPQFVSDSC